MTTQASSLLQRDINRQLWSEVSAPRVSFEKVGELLRLGANPKAQDSLGLDALMRVCARGEDDPSSAILTRLLLPMSDLLATDQRGWCAITIAVRARTIGALTELVAAEVPMLPDLDGLSPSAHARTESVKALMEAAELRELTRDIRKNKKVQSFNRI